MTFEELRKRSESLEYKTEVMLALVDYLEKTFLAHNAKHVLLTKSKVKVPQETFEEVISELFSYVEKLKTESTSIQSAVVVEPQKQSEPTVEATQPKGKKPKKAEGDRNVREPDGKPAQEAVPQGS